MIKRSSQRPDDGHLDRWLVSYADFITLLFAFFVVMYSISSVNEAKYKLFSDSIRYALTLSPGPNASFSPSSPTVIQLNSGRQQTILLNQVLVDKRTAELGKQQRKIEENMKRLAASLRKVMEPLILDDKVQISVNKRGVVVDISATTLFASADATLQPSSIPVLRAVADILGKEEEPIEVEGHTDDIPIATPQFPSNWELSSVRASSVARVLMESGIPEQRLSVVGLASNMPLVPNTSASNRSRNRRVSITIASPNLEPD